ncbi:MAG: chorismate--pyruvate lyase family protein [Endozoicomonas sp.]|uniref:chorismate--pyruvate lyase family protein n=1 Tax=Endozoicomonas sp. TaxID=1892382 RepID=UPI003D9AC8BA
MVTLPPFLRTLLVTDGTVTKNLEAYFWENVSVIKQGQKAVTLEQDLPLINARKSSEVFKRDVLLQGSESQHIYAFAESYLRPEALQEGLKEPLIKGSIGIGELLRETGLETYREIVDIGREMYRPAQTKHESFEVIYRVYVIFIGGQATIQITERFPYQLFVENTQ